MSAHHNQSVFSNLAPARVWTHFRTLCATPRASKQEGVLRQKIRDWATARGLLSWVDEAGNLIVRKPATPGREGVPGVILQAHLDMVCQKNADSDHDFSRDAIVPVVRDGWLRAEKTTLGADNGIGVALMLAVLEAADLAHGPIEALFTVDEEAGMGGARGLSEQALQGRLMLNLDTEAWGEFYLGCAGGMDVNVERKGLVAHWPAGYAAVEVAVRGLRGGHSGVDIHEGRGNAIKLLAGVLGGLEPAVAFRLSRFCGGSARNALPREAFAILAVPGQALPAVADYLKDRQASLRAALGEIDPGVTLHLREMEPSTDVLSVECQASWLTLIQAAPHGVRCFSEALPGVVETSNNLGMIDITPEFGQCNFMVRSLRDDGSVELADEIVGLFEPRGFTAIKAGYYPGWTPNPSSALLALCQRTYCRCFGEDSRVQVIHAGLECGIIGAKYPGMDIVSLGPTIRGAHAPGESVEIASVGRVWDLLQAIIADIQ